MQFTALGLWQHMGLFARLIVIVLGTMSLVSLVITLERLLAFLSSRSDSIRYAQATEQMLAQGRLYEAAQTHAGKKGGYLGRTMEAGLRAFTRSHGASREYVLETVGRAVERQAQREVQTMKRGQGIVATISSTAPFVGLLGTVLGIVTSFQAMASSGSGGLGTVSGGIAEALVTTAIGLLVAIPAVFAFNWMQGWVDARAVDLAESSNELLDTVGRALGSAQGAGTAAPQAEVQVSLHPQPMAQPMAMPMISSAPPPAYQAEHQVVTQSGVVPANGPISVSPVSGVAVSNPYVQQNKIAGGSR